jgi:chaperone required for assembly of F1-ATPase
MKRFYKTAGVHAAEGGFALALDGRPIKTPLKSPLVAPTERLAAAIATEWDSQGETVQPATMPLTRLANTVLDRVVHYHQAVATEVARYAETDLVCYRADWPADLVARQIEAWDPLVAWAQSRFDVALKVTAGVMPDPQSPETVERLAKVVAGQSAWLLAALHQMTTISGSLVIGLALLEGRIGLADAWAAGQLDELFQIERWGEDELAAQARAARKAELEWAHRFALLLNP